MPPPSSPPSAWVARQIDEAREHRRELIESIAGTLAEISITDGMLAALTGEHPPSPLAELAVERVPEPEVTPEPEAPTPEEPTPEPEPEPTPPEPEPVPEPESDTTTREMILEALEAEGGRMSTRALLAAIKEKHPEVERLDPHVLRKMSEDGVLERSTERAPDGFAFVGLAGAAVEQRPSLPKPEERKPSLPTPPRKERAPRKERTITHPGVEEMPEHLRAMPAASSNISLKMRERAAELQLAALRHVRDGRHTGALMAQHDTGSADDIAPDKKVSSKYSSTLRDLEQATPALVERTGFAYGPWQLAIKKRSGVGQGRPSVTYDLTPTGRSALGEEEEPSPPQPATDTLTLVRDVAVATTDVFSPSQIKTALDTADIDVPVNEVYAALVTLVRRGSLLDVSPSEEVPLFKYERPSSPGRAAELDMERRRGLEERPGLGSGPIAGTGRGLRAGNAAVQRMIDAAHKVHAEVTRTGTNHFLIKTKEGRRVVIGGTPNNAGYATDRRKLRAMGVPV